MTAAGWWTVGIALAIAAYPYVLYPVLLRAVILFTAPPRHRDEPVAWPMISITVPAFNEEAAIAGTIDRLLAADYPQHRRQILVVSDASTDRTDDIVRSYADRGVELLRLPVRRGKTGAENATVPLLRGEVVVNTDASVRVHPAALRHLAAAFVDPSVGVASSRDVSVASIGDEAVAGEGHYVDYEMWIRRLETRVYGIVGASGSLFAIRAALHRTLVPEALSRDFAAALIAREHGLRAVSVDEAVCFVPRGTSRHREYHRKVRTMARGLETLWDRRHMLNPLRYGAFAWILWSHKLMRWLVPWMLLAALAGLTVAAATSWMARVGVAASLLALAAAVTAWALPEEWPLPRPVAVPAFVMLGLVAALHAWIRALSGEMNPIWEPTRRAPKSG